jgi:hypothetical protein
MRTAIVAIVLSASLVACSAQKSPPPQQPAPEAAPPGYAAQPAAPPPPPSDASTASPQGLPPSTAPSPYAPPPNRNVAISQATNEIETSQRELDVAGGDCRNACRALGSMDRAAGRLCGLAQSNDEQRRCGDAKNRVYSARDKVRNTCGSCPDVSVDRNAPIPSR